MPVKGCRTHSKANWGSQLNLKYEGDIKYVFVLESKDDPAFQVLSDLALQHPSRTIIVLEAGLATACSQKCYNLVSGIRKVAAASDYVLCLDDDVALHTAALHDTVQRLEENSSLFMATGAALKPSKYYK